MSATRIVHIIGGLGIGGTECQLARLVRHTASVPIEHHIVVLNPHQNALFEPLERLGVRIWPLPQEITQRAHRLRWINYLVRRLRPDVIHSWAFHNNPYAGLAGLVNHVPRRVGSHRSDFLRRREAFWLRWLALRSIQWLVVNSRSTVEQIQTSVHHPPNLIYIPNIVEIPEESEPADPLPSLRERIVLVGTVGNLRSEKNHLLFVEALALLASRYEITGVLVGQPVAHEPEVLPRLQARARELGVEDRLLYLGFRTDVLALLRRFDIFCLTSDYEGMSNALLEAMAVGKPVVSTRVGGAPEVIQHGSNGLLVPPGNAGELARALETLIRAPEMRKRLGQAARQYILDQHTPEKVIPHWLRLYGLAP